MRGGVIRNREFVRLWSAQAISRLGTEVGALQFTALVFLRATPAQMGVLVAASGLPVLLISLPAGAWIDRVRRRPLMIASDLGRVVVLGTVPLAAALGRLAMGQLYLVALLSGALAVVFDVAYRSYLPSIVERDDLVDANSKLQLTDSAAEISGQAIGGALVQVIGGPAAVAVDAASFLLSGAAVAAMRTPEAKPSEHESGGGIREGIRAVARHPVLRALGGTRATFGFFGGFFGALYGVYGIQVLHLSPLMLGVTIGAGGVGSLAGALLARRLTGRLGIGVSLMLSRLVFGLLAFSIPLAGVTPAGAIAPMLVGQLLADPWWSTYEVTEISLRQAITPSHLLGRVNSGMHLLGAGAGPIGSLVAGVLAARIGIRGSLVIAACGMTASTLWLVASPVRRLRQMPTS